MEATMRKNKGIADYWNELKDLSSDDKLQIIMLLSSSMIEPNSSQAPTSTYTQDMLERFSGAWVGDETAEEIIDNINNGKHSHSDPVSFR